MIEKSKELLVNNWMSIVLAINLDQLLSQLGINPALLSCVE